MLDENIIESRIFDLAVIYIIQLKPIHHFKMLCYSKDKYKLFLNIIIFIIFGEEYIKHLLRVLTYSMFKV